MKETYDVMYRNRCSSAREAVSVICNETDKVVYELPIESYDVIFVSEDKKILKKMN